MGMAQRDWVGVPLGWSITPGNGGVGQCLTRLANYSPGMGGESPMEAGGGDVDRCLTRFVNHTPGWRDGFPQGWGWVGVSLV